MRLFDQHIHCRCSLDSDTPMAAMAAAARDRGMEMVCFTDHVETDDAHTGQISPNWEGHWPAVLAEYAGLMRDPPPGIEVRLGMELGTPNHYPALAALAAETPELDLVLGSLHNLRQTEDFYYLRYESEEHCRRLNELYLAELLEIAGMDCFDVMAHVGYTCRYMGRMGFSERITVHSSRDELTELFRRLISRGKGIEVNTSGIRQGGRPYPDADILALYRELGGEIVTVGSDGHVPGDAGAQVKEGFELLRSLGFRYAAAYKKRQPEFFPL